MHLNNKAPRRKTESGYALIVVLLVITVFSILGLTVMSVSFNHSKQFSKETTQTQALNVAEMGLKAYDQIIDNVLEQNINNDIPKSFDELVSRIDDKINDGTLPSELTADSKIQSLQGTPSYTVQMTKQNIPSLNEVKLSLTSKSNVQGDQKTITQVKTFKYDVTNNGDNTDGSNHLDLPELNGGLIMGGSNNDCLVNPQSHNGQMDNIYIYPFLDNVDKKCYRAINKSMIPNFTNDLNQIDTILKEVTSVTESGTKMYDLKPNVTQNGANSDWILPNADTSSLNLVTNSNFTKNVNFQDTKTDSSQIISFPENVSTKSFTIGANTVVEGNLFVNGNLNLDKPLTVRGNLFVKNTINQNSNGLLTVDGDLYTGQSLTFGQQVTIGGNLYSQGDLTFNSNTMLIINGNVYTTGNMMVNKNVEISKSAYISKELTLNGQAIVTVGNNLYVGGTTMNNGELYVGSSINQSDSNSDGKGIGYFNDTFTSNGNSRVVITGYSFYARTISATTAANKPASSFGRTVYVKDSIKFEQNAIQSDINPNYLYFKQGLVVAQNADLKTNGAGVIKVGPLNNENGNSGENNNSRNNVPITVSTSDTRYQ